MLRVGFFSSRATEVKLRTTRTPPVVTRLDVKPKLAA